MTSTAIIDLDQADFQTDVIAADTPVLIDFWAQWCQPCHMVAPTVDAIARDYAGRIKVAKVDIDANQGLARELGIASIPTLILYHKGEAVRRFVGVTAAHIISTAIEELLE